MVNLLVYTLIFKMELSYFHKAFVLFGKTHTDGKPRHCGHVLSIVHNVIHMICSLFVILGMLLSVKGEGLTLHISYTVQTASTFFWSFITSVVMFYMSRKRLFHILDPTQLHYRPGCPAKTLIILALLLPPLYTLSAGLYTAITLFPTYEKLCPKTARDFFTNRNCNLPATVLAMVCIFPSQFIVPYYIMVYCFFLAKEFQVLHETMEVSPHLFSGKADSLKR